jgi:hypothetical protein
MVGHQTQAEQRVQILFFLPLHLLVEDMAVAMPQVVMVVLVEVVVVLYLLLEAQAQQDRGTMVLLVELI